MIKHNGPDRDSGSKVKNRNCPISTLAGPEMAEITDFTFVTDRFIIPVSVKQSGLFRLKQEKTICPGFMDPQFYLYEW